MKGLQVGQSTRHGKECCSPASTDGRFTQAELVLQWCVYGEASAMIGLKIGPRQI